MRRRDEITPRVAILSSASRDAIEAIGGLENAERVTTARRSQLSRCQSTNDGDTLSLRDAIALDEATLARGGPHILQKMALLLGHVAIPVPTAPTDHEEIQAQIMTIAADLGDVSREAIEAERDGIWEPKEALRALARADELLAATAAMRSMLFNLAYPEEVGA